MVVWTWSGQDACLFRRCIDVTVVRVKVSRGTEPFFAMEIDSADTSQPPNGEIAWTNPIYFQITQPGSSTGTPLDQQRRQFKAEFVRFYPDDCSDACLPGIGEAGLPPLPLLLRGQGCKNPRGAERLGALGGPWILQEGGGATRGHRGASLIGRNLGR
jgi:hypothetical protein